AGVTLPRARSHEAARLGENQLARHREQPARPILRAHRRRTPPARHGARRLGARVGRGRERPQSTLDNRERYTMSILSDIAERGRALLFHSRDDRDLDEELRTHLAMEAEYLRRSGASDEHARRASAIALGGIERVKDDVRDARGTRLLHDVWRDVGLAA